MSTKICKVSFQLIFICLSSLLITACNYDKLAQNNLYPVEKVNETEVPKTPPKGYKQAFLPVKVGKDDFQVHVWTRSTAKNSVKPVLIYFHGNGVNLGVLAKSQFIQEIEKLNTHIVLMDYPSFGLSTGTPSEKTLLASGEATLAYAKSVFPRSPVIVWGRSLGTGVVSQLATEKYGQIDGWLLTSPWSKIRDMVDLHFGSVGKNVSKEWYSANVYDQVAAAKSISLPGVILHGNTDELIPMTMGLMVYKPLEKKGTQFIEIDGRGHNDIFQSDLFWVSIKEYVSRFR